MFEPSQFHFFQVFSKVRVNGISNHLKNEEVINILINTVAQNGNNKQLNFQLNFVDSKLGAKFVKTVLEMKIGN